MSPATAAEPVPLIVDSDGVMRVEGTRVTLDTIIAAYRRGDTPEQIAQDYSSLQAAEIYSVIAYYLRHRREVEAYLDRRQSQAEKVRQRFKLLFPSAGLRDQLKSRLR